MNLDSGRGEIIQRNATIYRPANVKIASVHHCNGSDVWVMSHELNTDRFLAYLITDTGISTNPVISQIGPLDNAIGSAEQGGNIKFSPNGKKLAITFQTSQISCYLFDFDNSTGILANPVRLHALSGSIAISFSPDNSKLYIGTTGGRLYQYNVEAGDSTDIYNSRKTISQLPTGFVYMQIGRDGKIYVAQAGNPHRKYLGVINNPNALDTLCAYNPQGVDLSPAYFGSDGLMNTIESYFYTGTSVFPCYGDTNINAIAADITDEIYGRVFPNPFADFAFVEISSVQPIQGKIEYQLLDALGREVNIQPSEISRNVFYLKAVLNGTKLKQGIYFLTVKANDSYVSIKIFIV